MTKKQIKSMIFSLKDIFFILNYLLNFFSLVLLNNGEIVYNNKNKAVYNIDIKEILA